MSKQPISYSPEEMSLFLQRMSDEELVNAVVSADDTFLTNIFINLSDGHVPDWRKKLTEIIDRINQLPKLELIGSVLQQHHFLEIFYHVERQTLPISKLFPLIVGMKQEVFEDFLAHADEKQLAVLRNENLKEPIQHHLKLYAVKTNAILNRYYEQLEKLEQKITRIKILDFSYQDLKIIENEINQLQDIFRKYYDNISKSLRSAWLCGRGDIVENLSDQREVCDRILTLTLTEDLSEIVPTSLNFRLHSQLKQVFNDPFASKHNKEDLAVEGIMHFAIHLQDFWNLGLIPGHEDSLAESGHLSLEKLDVNQIQHLDKIYEEIQHNLERKGLKTVGDLEEKKIYSKKMLYEYLQSKQYQPTY